MGEEEKKPEKKAAAAVVVAREEAPKDKEEKEVKADNEKKCCDAEKENQEGDDGEKKEQGGEEKEEAPPPPPPEEIEMRVFMHCEGCSRKVKHCLKGFEGVEDVRTDCRAHLVVVKGKKAAEDPMKVVERVQRKTGRKVELLSPLPPPPETHNKEDEKKEEEKPKPQEKEEPQEIVVVLKVHMHCEACAQEMKKRILKMKGVKSVEPDLKASQVTVNCVCDSRSLVEYVYKRTGKHAVVVKEELAGGGGAGDGAKEEKKADDAGGANAEGGGEDGAGDGDGKDKKAGGDGAAEEGALPPAKVVEMMRNELYPYYYPRYAAGYVGYAYPPTYPVQSYPPQIFSDENPNACSVM